MTTASHAFRERYGVMLSDGTRIDADMIIVGVGVASRTELARVRPLGLFRALAEPVFAATHRHTR